MQSENSVTRAYVCVSLVNRTQKREIKFGEQTDARFEDAYVNFHVTCEVDSAENVILDGHV